MWHLVKQQRNQCIIDAQASSCNSVHRMGKVEKPETLKVLTLMEVKALERSPDTNRAPEISLTLRRYRGDIPSTNLERPCD
jgi:hypothetical protein